MAEKSKRPESIEIKVNTDQTMLAVELIKTQSYIKALANTLLNDEQLENFHLFYAKELESTSASFLEIYKDLLKK